MRYLYPEEVVVVDKAMKIHIISFGSSERTLWMTLLFGSLLLNVLSVIEILELRRQIQQLQRQLNNVRYHNDKQQKKNSPLASAHILTLKNLIR